MARKNPVRKKRRKRRRKIWEKVKYTRTELPPSQTELMLRKCKRDERGVGGF